MKKAQFLSFPAGNALLMRWIKQYQIGLVIIDPIMAFLDEDVNSGVDAQVRRALTPFVMVLGKTGAAALMVRHLNKDASMKAAYRGGGSVAFGAIARVRLIAGELPKSVGSDCARGLMVIKTSNLRLTKGEALEYDVLDSDVAQDNMGSYVGKIEWGDTVSVTAQQLLNGDPKRPGRDPVRRDAVAAELQIMFRKKDPWLVRAAKTNLANAFGDDPPNHKTIDDALGVLGIRYYQDRDGHWWTMKPDPYRHKNG
jgi:hypothetical protein